jgi:hypothetical protein
VLKHDALYGWDASPIATSRLAAEVWGAIRQEDWSIGTSAAIIARYGRSGCGT